MQRRDFIRKGCVFCLAGGTAVTTLLESCTPLPVYKTRASDKKIAVPLTAFLQNDYLIVRPENLSYDIAVIKNGGNDFKSLIMLCTHADNALKFNGTDFSCNLHGSMFDRAGKVEKGPAERPLTILSSIVENDQLVITTI